MEFESSLDYSESERAADSALAGHLVFSQTRNLGRQEHTIAGQIIGNVRDSVSGGSRATEREQIQRAGQNDQIAHIVADTVAFLPSMKLLAAAGIRATLLVSPNKGAGDNAWAFGKNFLEGAALNKVGKFAHPESRFSKYTRARWGMGLKSELATHVSIGFGMGTVKASFNPETWTTKEGDLSLLGGLGTTLKTGLTASAFSVPAGMLGVRINKAATLAVTRGTMSEATGFVIAGAGSGYAGGAVFGGLDGLITGKSFSEIVEHMHYGGLIGAGTGMFVHGYETMKVQNRFNEVATRPRRQEVSRPASGKSGDAPDEIHIVAGKERKVVDYAEEQLLIPVEKFDSPEILAQRQAELYRRLTAHEKQTETHKTLADGVKDTDVFTDFADFSKRALKDVAVEVRVYDVDGHPARIVVPEEYALQLDQVRSLRLRANQRGDLYRDGVVQARNVAEARLALENHPLRNRALPEDFIPLLDELPDRSLVKRLMILGGEDPANRWNEQSQGKGFRAAADASDTGTIRFYGPENHQVMAGDASFRSFESLARSYGEIVRKNLFHEWSHLLGFKNRDDAALFELAANIERNGWYAREYAKRQYADTDGVHPGGENWSVHLGEELLAASPQGMYNLVREAPIRTAMMGRALMRSLIGVQPGNRSIHHDTYINRIGYLNEQVMPKAMELTLKALLAPDRNAQVAAAKLLGEIGRTEVVGHLKQTAIKTRDSEFAAAALESALKIEGRNGSRDNQFDVLLAVGLSRSPAREAAIDGMWKLRHPRALMYKKFMELAGDTKNLRDLVDLVPKMPDSHGKTLAFREALALAKKAGDGKAALDLMRNSPDSGLRLEAYFQARAHLSGMGDRQTKLDVYALKLFPELRMKALDHLRTSAEPWTKEHVARFTDSPDTELAAQARTAIDAINRKQSVLRLSAHARTGPEEARIKAIEGLANLKDHNTIPLLLELQHNSVHPAVKFAAGNALSAFPNNLVTFYRRAFLVRRGSENAS